MNSAIFVIGPAGVGKSTFCRTYSDYIKDIGYNPVLFNIDPGAINGKFHVSITLEYPLQSVMSTYKLGPNGGMMKCLELMSKDKWLDDCLSGYTDEFVIVDCPGQIELYSHETYMNDIINIFQQNNYNCASVYLVDYTYQNDRFKYNAALLNGLASSMNLNIPHLNCMTKMDMAENTDIKIDEKTSSPLQTQIESILDNFIHQTMIPIDITSQEDLFIIHSYLKRMMGDE